MKKMIQESIHRPYTITEGLLCFATGLLVISTFGFPVFAKGSLLVVAAISTALTIITSYLENDFSVKRNDAPLFAIIAVISFISSAIIGESIMTALFRTAGVLCLVYAVYFVMLSFLSEPPDSMENRKKGLTLMPLTVLLFVLPDIIQRFF